jgi:predicted PurR-regulated permease PerM
MSDGNYSKNFFLAALFTLAILTLLILKPLMIPLMSAGLLAYLFYPLFLMIGKKLKSKRVAAWIIIVMLLFLITIPMYFATNTLTKEGYTLFITVKQKLASDELKEIDCIAQPSIFCGMANNMIQFITNPQVKFYVEDGISKLSSYVISKTTGIIANLPLVIVGFFVMFFAIYYLLLDGTEFVNKIKASVPLKSHHVDDIVKQFENFTYATIYGSLITSVIQGIIGGIIFFFLGLQTPILAGVAMAFFGFLPFIGTPIIWIPAAISLAITGEMTKAIILLILGVFIISSIDNFIKPEIIGKRTRLHPAATLVGIIGGIALIGPLGVVVGPLIISLLISFIEVYYKEGY